jgi:hypothetical protein
MGTTAFANELLLVIELLGSSAYARDAAERLNKIKREKITVVGLRDLQLANGFLIILRYRLLWYSVIKC